jgi:threonylcarbamoyladenosine tRNA methylthiotransferase MtaB
MARVYAAFVGCKVSQADSEAAAGALARAGHTAVDAPYDADVCVVTSCCVTAEAERKSRQLARRLAADGRRVIVAGCAAVLRPEQFRDERIEPLAGRDWSELALAPVPGRTLDGRAPQEGEDDRRAAARRTRLTLKVQDGCDERCAYCAVRLARGPLWSLPLADAVAAARAGLANGCGEVVGTRVKVGYKRAAEHDLAALVTAIKALPDLARLRLSSIEPGHVTPALLAALTDERIARHLHMPLQSADDGVLAAMRRPYRFADYCATVAAVRQALGEVMISTDVIVGFPGESEAAFARTLAAIDAGSGLFGRVHVFAYSPRTGTEAVTAPPLPASVVKQRMRAALAAAGRSAERLRAAALDSAAEVLLEERRDGFWRGYSSKYVRYYLRPRVPEDVGADPVVARRAGADPVPGRLVRAFADEVYKDGVKGWIE